MARIVMIVPALSDLSLARTVVNRLGMDVDVFYESSQTVLSRLETAQRQGALVAVARGNHANLILKHLDIPLVEMRLSGQSIAKLLSEAKTLAGAPRPRVAFVGFQNMFTDTRVFDSLLDVDVRNYFVPSNDELEDAVRHAQRDGAQVVIGGEIAIEHARALGLQTLFCSSTAEDMEFALHTAKRMVYAIEMEQKNTAEISTLLNYSFDGVFRLSDAGAITSANYMAERIFRKRASEIIGRNVSEFFDAQDSAAIMDILRTGKKKYGMMLHCGGISLVANAAAISVENALEGGILSFQEFQVIEALEEDIRRDRYSKGFSAHAAFDTLPYNSPAMRRQIAIAQQYAKYDLPVLLYGEMGTGKHTLAECIHNASMRRKNPFFTFDCASIPESIQQRMLVADDGKSAFQVAHTGTLFIDNIDRLEAFGQYQLLSGLRNGIIWQHNHTQALPVNVRIIAATSADLPALVRAGKFSEPLYCLLSQLELLLPPLRERPEDIPPMMDLYLDRFCTMYRKYIVLTDDARQLICQLSWPGNALQLSLFIEKLTLVSETKVVDADAVRRYLPAAFQGETPPSAPPAAAAAPPVVVYGDRETRRILELLEKHDGNRTRVAAAMGVSKSTLWRKMKKLGIENTFRA